MYNTKYTILAIDQNATKQDNDYRETCHVNRREREKERKKEEMRPITASCSRRAIAGGEIA